MRRFASTVTTLTLAVATAGCSLGIRRLSTTMQEWVGKPDAELIAQWGAPDRTATLGDTARVLTWITTWNSADDGEPPTMTECRRSFTISRAGQITRWSAGGCPSLYIPR
jgi:hypothetical protein